jgi:hypothetical protein
MNSMRRHSTPMGTLVHKLTHVLIDHDNFIINFFFTQFHNKLKSYRQASMLILINNY